MSSECCENCVKPGDKLPGAPEGKITTYAGVEAYVVGTSKERALIYSVDVYGHEFPNHQRNADRYAAGGYTVIIPKTLNDAMQLNDDFSKFGEWLGRNPTKHATEVCTKVVDEARKEFKFIGALGFCYGARVVADLIEAKKLDAGVCFHPTFLKAEDAPAIKATGIPVRFNCAETDSIFVPELRSKFESELKGANGTFQEYPGTQHGFAARPSGEQAQKSCTDAHADTLAWLNKLA